MTQTENNLKESSKSHFSKRSGTILDLCSQIAQTKDLTNKKKFKHYDKRYYGK